VRAYVRLLEHAVIDLLGRRGIRAEGKTDAPGVYVDGAKIAALGLRIRHGRCYHGLALNVDMDLTPFDHIDPCGYRGLRVTQARDLGVADPIDRLADELSTNLSDHLCRTKAGAS
jgi:lipoyl(octanoyl) transferase